MLSILTVAFLHCFVNAAAEAVVGNIAIELAMPTLTSMLDELTTALKDTQQLLPDTLTFPFWCKCMSLLIERCCSCILAALKVRREVLKGS